MSDLDVAALRRAAKPIGIGQEYCYVPKKTLNTLLDDRERVAKLERALDAEFRQHHLTRERAAKLSTELRELIAAGDRARGVLFGDTALDKGKQDG
jgi:hypothetical protein